MEWDADLSALIGRISEDIPDNIDQDMVAARWARKVTSGPPDDRSPPQKPPSELTKPDTPRRDQASIDPTGLQAAVPVPTPNPRQPEAPIGQSLSAARGLGAEHVAQGFDGLQGDIIGNPVAANPSMPNPAAQPAPSQYDTAENWEGVTGNANRVAPDVSGVIAGTAQTGAADALAAPGSVGGSQPGSGNELPAGPQAVANIQATAPGVQQYGLFGRIHSASPLDRAPGLPEPELRTYDMSLSERVKAALQDALMAAGAKPYDAGHFAGGLTSIVGATPVGIPMAFDEMMRAAKRRDLLGVAIAGLSIAPPILTAGPFARAAARALRSGTTTPRPATGTTGPRLIGSFEFPAGMNYGNCRSGQYAHKETAIILQELHLGAPFELRVLPSQKGIDVTVPGDFIGQVGFRYGEIKPLSVPGERKMMRQIRDWGFDPKDVQPITLTPMARSTTDSADGCPRAVAITSLRRSNYGMPTSLGRQSG